MSAAHTPGPWAVNPFAAQVDSAELCKDGSLVPVCQLLWPTQYRDEATTEANALLIAAAPDLLALVIQYRDDLRRPPAPSSVTRRLEATERAIAKATGQ